MWAGGELPVLAAGVLCGEWEGGREEGREEENVQNLHTNVLSRALEHC